MMAQGMTIVSPDTSMTTNLQGPHQQSVPSQQSSSVSLLVQTSISLS